MAEEPKQVELMQLLPAIPGHSHAIGPDGKLTCGCEWPSAKAAEMVKAVIAMNKSRNKERR